jgi:putative restriction endonuclease
MCQGCFLKKKNEEPMTDLTTSIKQFASLGRAPGPTGATKCKAPHKPLLLLAVLDLVHR